MNKRDQLIEYITQDIIAFLVEDRKIDIAEAMKVFYNSETYEKLLDEDIGLYYEGAPYVYEILKDEMEQGHLIQNKY